MLQSTPHSFKQSIPKQENFKDAFRINTATLNLKREPYIPKFHDATKIYCILLNQCLQQHPRYIPFEATTEDEYCFKVLHEGIRLFGKTCFMRIPKDYIDRNEILTKDVGQHVFTNESLYDIWEIAYPIRIKGVTKHQGFVKEVLMICIAFIQKALHIYPYTDSYVAERYETVEEMLLEYAGSNQTDEETANDIRKGLKVTCDIHNKMDTFFKAVDEKYNNHTTEQLLCLLKTLNNHKLRNCLNEFIECLIDMHRLNLKPGNFQIVNPEATHDDMTVGFNEAVFMFWEKYDDYYNGDVVFNQFIQNSESYNNEAYPNCIITQELCTATAYEEGLNLSIEEMQDYYLKLANFDFETLTM